ncbi:MAG: hypothetical protein KDA87_03420 [Planctomycetales bacterium]|nr:hypothetical protein [Planctomycetales bacterium]
MTLRHWNGGSVIAHRQRLMAMVIAILSVGVAGPIQAEAIVAKADTSRAAKEAAIQDIPFASLTPEAQQKIQAVVSKPSMFRRMPVNVIDCDPELYRFLIRNPEVVVNIWQLMGITKVSTVRTGPYTLDASDGMGTDSKVELVFGNNDTHLIYCDGMYEGPLFRKPLQGKCVLLLKSGYVQREDGRWHITSRLDVFVEVENVAVDVLAKTLHPLLGKSADTNFQESIKFLERISRTAEANDDGMDHLAGRLDVQPDIKSQFSQITQKVFDQGQERLARQTVPVDATVPTVVQQR